MKNEKHNVALSSVLAAVFLTLVKIIVGIISGSLGIISEAAHSAFDLFAAIITLVAVNLSDKPADKKHNYGHGKVESFSALIETLLLLVTCVWIIYEAIERLFFSKSVAIENSIWGIAIMLLSIIINISRSRALKRVAHKHKSHALEADAIHFDSDIWSSLVVIFGLSFAWIGDIYNIKIFQYADPIAALGVSVLVIVVSIKLGKRTIDVLLDTVPAGMVQSIYDEVISVNGVLEVSNIRARQVGANTFIDLSVGINRNENHVAVHSIVNQIKQKLKEKIDGSDIIISTYPIDFLNNNNQIYNVVKNVVDKFSECTNIHKINIYEVNGKKHISIHLEIMEDIDLKESHELSHKISELIQNEIDDVADVNINFELMNQKCIIANDVTEDNEQLIKQIKFLINKAPSKLNCHDIKVYSQGQTMSIFLHCGISGNYNMKKIELISQNISKKIRKNVNNIDSIHIHVEPMNDGGR